MVPRAQSFFGMMIELVNGKIKKRDEMTDKNGKVNEKSKWKNW